MSEHPLDRELRILIDKNHARLEALVDLANVLSDARRMEDELDFDARVLSSVARSQANGGPINQQAPSVAGNGAYASGGAGLGYYPHANGQVVGAPSSPISQVAPYSLKEALQKAAVEQTPYPEETTYPGVPGPYRKAYGY